MSEVTTERWDFWMGDMPMPEGCTSEMMWAMYDTIKKIEAKDYAVEQLAFYEGLWRKWKPKYDFYNKHKDENEDYMGHFNSYCDIMKSLKEIIQYNREEIESDD